MKTSCGRYEYFRFDTSLFYVKSYTSALWGLFCHVSVFLPQISCAWRLARCCAANLGSLPGDGTACYRSRPDDGQERHGHHRRLHHKASLNPTLLPSLLRSRDTCVRPPRTPASAKLSFRRLIFVTANLPELSAVISNSYCIYTCDFPQTGFVVGC